MNSHHIIRLLAILLGLSLSTGSNASDAGDERIVLLKIHSTRILTAHLSLGYDRNSVKAMARLLKPSDVPALVRLYNRNEDRLGVGMAIATQCGSGLDGLANVVNDFSYDFIQLLGDIAQSDHCDAMTRARAESRIKELQARQKELLEQARHNKDIEQNKQRQTFVDEINRHSRNAASDASTDISTKGQ